MSTEQEADAPFVPDQDAVRKLLDQMELASTIDDDGDLVAPWQDFRVYFMFRGDDEDRAYSVRTFYDRPHPIDKKPELLLALDDWHRRTLWPNVYTHTGDDGTVKLISESTMLIGQGVTVEHFVSSTVSWVRAAIEFDNWLTEQPGLTESGR